MRGNHLTNLVIDAGNTRCKAGIFHDSEIQQTHVFDNENLKGLLELCEQVSPDAAILSSVSKFPDELKLALQKQIRQFFELGHTTPLPVTNSYKHPETLGKDRLAAVCGAAYLSPGHNVLTIDAGTCITYDFLKEGKEYKGGAISPGLHMRFNALHHYTARLPHLLPEEISYITGSSTTQSILSGVINGIVFEMEGFIRNWKENNIGLKVYLSGGDANFLAKNLKSSIFVTPNLVLTGLNQILLFNVEKI